MIEWVENTIGFRRVLDSIYNKQGIQSKVSNWYFFSIMIGFESIVSD